MTYARLGIAIAPATVGAARVVAAIGALHAACLDAHGADDGSFGEAGVLVSEAMDRVADGGDGVDGWAGDGPGQYAALAAGFEMLMGFEAPAGYPRRYDAARAGRGAD